MSMWLELGWLVKKLIIQNKSLCKKKKKHSEQPNMHGQMQASISF